MKNVGLVLEGGGMRGVYTGGVLEFFSEHQLFFPYVIGVSAGACNGASYVSRQRGRNYQVTVDLVNHPNYISYKNLLKRKGLFGMDFIFDEIPNKLVPFDYQTFEEVPETFLIGTTNCDTGDPVYFEKKNCLRDVSTVLRASSSLPLMAPMVSYKGLNLLDGGISDPIPIKKSVEEGNSKNVVILTRNLGYRKQRERFTSLLHRPYKKRYPNLIEKMNTRHNLYNETLQYIEEEEMKGNTFVLRPTQPLQVGRIERDKQKLHDLYQLGYNDAKQIHAQLQNWLHG
ncbi:patatin family protein [Anaerobacillus alkaliphilus]|uniref:Patatin family protein n=1 Tax=Anaerobacillus alkaliphilus TaxID=1548597 RepID=A0A4Q0VWM9_9BACI|nr:patatin family protein [Anaerobacillus alkaliphilus]RXJ04044.1 patatin family protein [Anaerobacillus alkaliphilus]